MLSPRQMPQVVTTIVPLLIGGRVAMWDRFSASTFWDTVAQFEPVTFSSVPTMLAALLHAPGADQAETNTLRFVICGAAPLSPALFRRFDDVIEYSVPDVVLAEALLRARLDRFDTRGLSWHEAAEQAVGLSQAEVVRAADDAAKSILLRNAKRITSEALIEALTERRRATLSG